MMTMLRLGSFDFSIATAAFQSLSRSTEYKWKAQERIGAPDALQFLGEGVDSITLDGVIFPAYRGGARQPDEMRRFAAAGVPLLLITGSGEVLGQWIIERVDETQSVFIGPGLPRRQSFTLQIRKYGDG